MSYDLDIFRYDASIDLETQLNNLFYDPPDSGISESTIEEFWRITELLSENFPQADIYKSKEENVFQLIFEAGGGAADISADIYFDQVIFNVNVPYTNTSVGLALARRPIEYLCKNHGYSCYDPQTEEMVGDFDGFGDDEDIQGYWQIENSELNDSVQKSADHDQKKSRWWKFW